jgi:hypothetical protein
MRHLKIKVSYVSSEICNMLVLEPLACIVAMAFWSLTRARVDAILWQNAARTVHLPGVCNIWIHLVLWTVIGTVSWHLGTSLGGSCSHF